MIKKIKLTKDQKKRIAQLELLLSALLFMSFPFCFIGSKGIENYPQWFSFLLLLICTGIVLAVVSCLILYHFAPETKTYKNAKGFKLSFHIYFAFTCLSIGSGFLINGHWSRHEECKTYPIVKRSKKYYYKDHYLFIQKEGVSERISFGPSFYKAHWKDEFLSLSIVTGCLGFDYYEYPCP